MKLTKFWNRRVAIHFSVIIFLILTSSLFGQTGFIHTDGTLLKDETGTPYRIQGIAFGNNVWQNPSLPVTTHHDEKDYQRLNEMGFNSVRFYINYGLFESDSNPYHYKESGFLWIDKNIAWAKKYGIRLILNMHYPQGGFQSNGDGSALWNDSTNQQRLIALWKAIAQRYANEPTILGYSLLNEPFLEHSFKEYELLLKGLVYEIRSVDPLHILIVEKANGLRWAWDDNENKNMNFVLLKDSNIMYEFHFYEPIEFTHQNASWTGFKGMFEKYPNSSIYKVSGDKKWESATWDSPKLDVKDTTNKNKWIFVQSPLIKVTNSNYFVGVPVFVAKNIGKSGKAWANGFVIKEYDENKKLVKIIMDTDGIDKAGWYYWSANESGSGTSIDKSYISKKSLYIEGSTGDGNMTFSNGQFPLSQGHYYQLSGYINVDNVGKNADVRLRLDYYSLNGTIVPLDKSYLELRMKRYIDWGKENNVPLYLGEFGVIADGFTNDRGGLIWVEDVIDICQKYGINFNYHTYHEYKSFGLYRTEAEKLPANLNVPLANLFKKKLKQ
jgi:endoglucanase